MYLMIALELPRTLRKVVLQNLLICVILFYTVYYAVLGMCCMMLKVYELDVLAPFDFKTYPSWLNTNYKGKALQDNWVDLEECLHPHEQFMRLLYIHGYQLCVPNDYLNMPFYYKDTKELIFKLGNDWYQRNVLTYLVCGLLFVLVVEEWVWDYAISVTILHVVITSTVMLEFPLTSHWWAALGSGLISMIGGGQAFAYCLFKDNFIYPDLEEF